MGRPKTGPIGACLVGFLEEGFGEAEGGVAVLGGVVDGPPSAASFWAPWDSDPILSVLVLVFVSALLREQKLPIGRKELERERDRGWGEKIGYGEKPMREMEEGDWKK